MPNSPYGAQKGSPVVSGPVAVQVDLGKEILERQNATLNAILVEIKTQITLLQQIAKEKK